jgi:flagellar basal body rod protein FlgC
MRKFLTFFLTALLAFGVGWAKTAGFSLAAGGTVPIAANANPATATITGTQGETWNVAIEGTFSSSSFQGRTDDRYWQMGSNSASFDVATFSTSGINGTITKIVVVCASGSSNGSLGQLSVDVNNQAFSPTQVMPLWANNTGGELTFTGSASGPISIKIFPVTKKACYIQSITVTYEDSSPSITFDPNPLNINDNGGTFTVSGSYLPTDGLGVVHYSGDYYTNLGDLGFSYSLDNNLDYFPTDNGAVVDREVTINYNGRELSASGQIGFASGSVEAKATVNYLYNGDIYIVGNLGSGWHFTDASHKMTYDTGNKVFTATLENVPEDSYIMFSRDANQTYYWEDDTDPNHNYYFFGAEMNNGADWEFADNAEGNVGVGNLSMSPNSNTKKYCPIHLADAGTYTVTIDPAITIDPVSGNPLPRKFIIEKAAEPAPLVTYVKVTNTNQLVAGKKYIFVQEASQDINEPQAMGAISNGFGTGIPVTITDNKVVAPANVLVFTLSGTARNYKLVGEDGKYLRGNNGTSLSLGDDANNATWNLNNNNAAISGYRATNVQYNTRSIKWHHSQNRFGHYANSDTQSSYSFLYVEDDNTTPPEPEKVKTPTFSIEAGTYNVAQNVEISCATSGATIYYTTDGSTPTNESAVYSEAITVSKTTTIKAFATLTGMDDSEVAEAIYTIIYEANNLAAAKALGDDQEFNFTGDVVVTFKQTYTTTNGTHTLIGLRDVDATEGGGVFHNAKAATYNLLDKGSVLNPGWTADKETYSGWIQFEDISNVTTAENTAEVLPFDRTNQTMTTANQSEYIILNNVTIADGTVTVNNGAKGATYAIYDLFNQDQVTIANGQYKSLIGVVGVNDGTVYVYPLELEKAQVATPTITPNGGEFTSAQEVSFATTTEGAETWYSLDNENWTKAATYTVDRSGKIYVKATKEGWTDSEVAEATFTINYAPITVTIEPNEQTYTVGDEAKVKVTVTGTVGDDATVTYMFGENTPATVDDEGYVTIPTTEAGTVTLTVTASDSYHSVPVTATGTYTVNHKALSVTLNPANNEYTVGDEAKVKVTVENAVGEYVVSGKIDEKDYDVDENGYITLPNDKAVEEMILTVTAIDDRENAVEATTTGTYKFNAAPAIGISLTATPEADTYTVGEGPTVTVTVNGTIGNDVVITYLIGDDEQVYNPETGIIIDRETAGTVTLTVNVTDGFDHQGAVNGVTSQTAAYTFAAAPAIEIGFDPESGTEFNIGDVAKVHVTVTGSIGEDVIEILVNGEDANLDEEGKAILPNNAAGTVTVTVNVSDDYEHIGAVNGVTTATAEYTFNKLKANVNFSEHAVEAVFGEDVDEPTVTTTPTGLSLKYESSKPEIATVDADGNVTTKGIGKTTITATFEGNDNYGEASDSYELTVKQATAGLSYPEGTSVTATVGDNNVVEPTLDNPNELPVTWSSDNESVATVDEEGNVTIVGPGIAHITATYTAGEGSNYETGSATYTITVNDVEVNIAKPTFAPAGDTYTEPKWVAIACATPDVNIEYKIGENGTWTKYEKPFEINESCKVYAKASKGAKVVYNDSEVAEAEYTINAKAPAAIENNYYNLINNGLPNKFANVAGRRTLNFVDNPDAEAGTIFRIATDGNGKVLTLRSQACDIQDYAKRAMNYVPVIVQTVINKLNNTEGVNDATGAGNILGENGLQALLDKFNECFDYNLYVEGGENAYRIYARTPSMQNVVDFYAEHKDQVDEKLPMLEGYINQVLAKIRSKVESAHLNPQVFEDFDLVTLWEEMGGTLIKPDNDENVMRFYEQVLTNKEYVWDFAYYTAKHYLDNIKGTTTYQNLINLHPEIESVYLDKLEEIRPETKFFIIQNGNEPDYVSETHSYITGNEAKTYWTLTPRTDYKVTFPAENVYNGQLVTTLYTDFAYDVPEGVTAYTVTGVKTVNDKPVAELTAIGKNVPAQTPVLLMTPAAKADVTKTVALNTNDGTPIENELKGPDYLIKNYGINSPTVQAIFNMAAGLVPADMLAQYAYLMLRTSGTVNNKYFWNVNDALDSCVVVNQNNLQDCIVRSLSTKTGELAFSEHWKTETNKAFLVSETNDVIYLAEAVKPTFDPFPGSYDEAQLSVTIDAGGAAIQYSTDGGDNWYLYTGPITVDKDMTIIARTEGVGETAEATGVYVINKPVETITIDGFNGYFQIKNNGNGKYANVAGRKTLNFVDDPADKAGTVIYADIDTNGKVNSLRSQAADLQRYADRAVSYVPEIVELVAEKLNADGTGNILGANGLDAILAKFDESFDHHLYVEPADGGYRIFGRTPSMQPVVDFYRENKDRVEAKLPDLETFINNALRKLRERIGGSSVFTDFSLHQIWYNMGGTLTEPTDDVTTMTFYREVLNNKNYVWNFAYQTALIYLNNVKNHPRWDEIEAQLGEYAQYIDMLEQVHPEFKYYIVQKDGKPDFISEGNTDIINNAARTIWTVEPRTEFTVNIPENAAICNKVKVQKATTLYTDFAYDLPDGVTAYKVTEIDGDFAKTEAIGSYVPAQTPVLLMADVAGEKVLTLNTENGTPITGNLLVGADYFINEYKLKTPQVASLFELVKNKLGQAFYDNYVAEYEHLMYKNSGTVNNKYFWGLTEVDLDSCCVKNENGEMDCVVRTLAKGEDGNKKLAFYNLWKAPANQAFLASTENPVRLSLRGDVNHDGNVNIHDVTDLIDRLLVMPDADHLIACPYCSDVNEDTAVSIHDVTVLIDILLADGANTTVPGEGEGEGNGGN